MGSFVSPAPVDVGVSTSQLADNSVGTYAALGYIGGGPMAYGSLIAGSSLRQSSFYTDQAGYYGFSGVSVPGTWALRGHLGIYNYTSASVGLQMASAVWVRVA